MGKYLDICKRFEAKRHTGGRTEPQRAVFPVSSPQGREFHTDVREEYGEAWICPNCENPATIDDVFSCLDGEHTLTMWSCGPCQVVAVTPDAIRQPPTGWVKRTNQ
jgi:hypothetical protein